MQNCKKIVILACYIVVDKITYFLVLRLKCLSLITFFFTFWITFPLFWCTDTKALWDNIVYNPVTQTLAWEPSCPVLVIVNLCRLMKSNDHCEDIQDSSKRFPEKVRAIQLFIQLVRLAMTRTVHNVKLDFGIRAVANSSFLLWYFKLFIITVCSCTLTT